MISENDILEFSIELNTEWGYMANMPMTWWDSDENNVSCIKRKNGVTMNIRGRKNDVLQWLFNMARDGAPLGYPQKNWRYILK